MSQRRRTAGGGRSRRGSTRRGRSRRPGDQPNESTLLQRVGAFLEGPTDPEPPSTTSVRPRLTARGRFVAVVAAFGLVMGYAFGGRTLDAVVVPAAALLAIGAIQVARTGDVSVTRRTSNVAHVGDTVRVRLTVTGDTGVAVSVFDGVPDGLDGDGRFEALADGRTVSYEATVTDRGVHDIGPATVAVRDLFGLWERVRTAGGVDELVAFPQVHSLHESAGLLEGYVGLSDDREQFDGIREYESGDALRDVNWKASAKRPGELVVTEYAGEGAHNRVTVGVTAPAHRDDAAAEAAASVVAYLFEHGLAVGVVTPSELVRPGAGDAHRRRILTALARFEGGAGDERDFAVEPDLTVRAPADGRPARIELGGTTHSFADVVGDGRVVA